MGDADKGGVSLFRKEIPLPCTLPEKIHIAGEQLEELWRLPNRMPARGVAAFRATIRFASAPTIRCCAAVGGSAALRMRHTPCGCRSAHLVEVQTNLLLATMHTVSIMRTAASEAMPLRQAIPGLIESEVERSYVRVMNRRQSDSEDRRRQAPDSASIAVLRAVRLQWRGQGARPLAFSWGPRGIFSHVREYPPFPVQRLRRCFLLRAMRGKI